MNDHISRQAAIDATNDWLLDCFKVQKQDRSCGLIRRLEDLSSAQLERTKGKWEKGVGENGVTTSLFCSECNYENTHWYDWNYCPNCGARMDDVEKMGHWVDHIKDFWCSECGCRILPEQVDSFSKCPQCGARMDEVE